MGGTMRESTSPLTACPAAFLDVNGACRPAELEAEFAQRVAVCSMGGVVRESTSPLAAGLPDANGASRPAELESASWQLTTSIEAVSLALLYPDDEALGQSQVCILILTGKLPKRSSV